MDSINNLTMKKFFVSALVALCGLTASYAQQASFLSNNEPHHAEGNRPDEESQGTGN